MSLIAATQITAIATAILAFFAIVTAVLAYLAFRKQAAEVAVVQQQVRDQQALNRQQLEVLGLQAQDLRASLGERDRAAARDRDAQARQVIGWQEHFTSDPRKLQPQTALYGGRPVVAASVQNMSPEPIYDVQITWHGAGSAKGEPEAVADVMPSETRTLYREPPEHAIYGTLGADLRFRDARGVRWRRRLADGELTEDP
jgi:hypothetical protein